MLCRGEKTNNSNSGEKKAPDALQILTSLQQLGVTSADQTKTSEFSTITAFTKQKG